MNQGTTSTSRSAAGASSKSVSPLQPEALEALAQIIGDNFTGNEITRLFARAGYSSIVHDGSTKWRFVADQFQQLQRRHLTANGVLAVVKTAGSPQGWLGRREQFEAFLGSVNQVLEFYALRLQDGDAPSAVEIRRRLG